MAICKRIPEHAALSDRGMMETIEWERQTIERVLVKTVFG